MLIRWNPMQLQEGKQMRIRSFPWNEIWQSKVFINVLYCSLSPCGLLMPNYCPNYYSIQKSRARDLTRSLYLPDKDLIEQYIPQSLYFPIWKNFFVAGARFSLWRWVTLISCKTRVGHPHRSPNDQTLKYRECTVFKTMFTRDDKEEKARQALITLPVSRRTRESTFCKGIRPS